MIIPNGVGAVIGGGSQNTNGGVFLDYGLFGPSNRFVAFSTIGGGWLNTIDTNAVTATVAGGYRNRVGTNAQGSAIGGGQDNAIGSESTAATVGGGSGNTIAENGASSTIAGGSGNHVLGQSSSAAIGGGGNNEIQSSAVYGTIGGGYFNRVYTGSGYATVGGGIGNYVSTNSDYATIGGGSYNNIQTNANYATIPGGRYGRAFHYGQLAYAGGRFSTSGDAQTSIHVLRHSTSTTNLTELFLDGSGASERMTIPSGATWTFEILVAARNSAGNSAGWQIRGVIENVSSTVNFVGTPLVTSWGSDTGTWSVVVEADNTYDALTIKAQAMTLNPVRWVATVRTAEVTSLTTI